MSVRTIEFPLSLGGPRSPNLFPLVAVAGACRAELIREGGKSADVPVTDRSVANVRDLASVSDISIMPTQNW